MSANEEHLRSAIEALQAQLRFLKQDFDRGETERVVFALQSMRFLASRIEEGLTRERVSDGTQVAWGPPVRSRIDARGFHEAIVEIMEQRNGPVSVKELMEELEAREIPVPGQGKPANVVGHLGRISGVKRVGHGLYRLTRQRNATNK